MSCGSRCVTTTAWFAVVFNLYGFWKEYHAVLDNTRTIQELNNMLEEKGLVEREKLEA